MKKELKKRWETLEGQKMLHEVIHCLSKGKLLSKVHGLEKYCGRWDLRGAKLSSLAKEHVVKVKEYSFSNKIGTLKLNNCTYNAIDFSYADISYSMWRRVNLENCIFHNAICKELYIVASNFKQCVFNNANLADSYLNNNIGREADLLINPRVGAMMRGKGIDRAYRKFASKNWVLKPAEKIKILKINPTNRGADMVGRGLLKGTWWDVTTAGSWQAHVKKYGAGGIGLIY